MATGPQVLNVLSPRLVLLRATAGHEFYRLTSRAGRGAAVHEFVTTGFVPAMIHREIKRSHAKSRCRPHQ